VDFKKDFDLKNYVVKTFGQPKPADIYKKATSIIFSICSGRKKLLTICYGSSARFTKMTPGLCSFSAESAERNGGWTELNNLNLMIDKIKKPPETAK
jgi:hypothetical protein